MITLKKKKKLQSAVTNAHTVKVVERILRRMIERKFEDVLGEDHIGFRRGKELGMQFGC
jgi:hypothetical protein